MNQPTTEYLLCPRCSYAHSEASILSAAARIQVSRRRHASGGGRTRELPDCPHCGKKFGDHFGV